MQISVMAGWLRTCGLRLCGRSVRFAAIAFVLCFTVVLTVALPTVTWAANLQSSQASEQPAILVGPKEDAPIPLYLRPAANQPNVGYGMSGAVVTVLEQVASFLPEADQSAAWNHIRLEDAPFTEGWVQGRFLLMQQEAD